MNDAASEQLSLGDRARPVFLAGVVAAAAGILLALLLGHSGESGLQGFYFAYLASFALYLSIALGALFFVLMQHLTRAAWSVGIRRIAETLAATLPVLGVLSVPILASVAVQNGTLYRWALPYTASTPEARQAAAKHEALRADEEALDNSSPPATSGPRILDSITLQKRAWLNPWFMIARVIVYFAIWSAMALWYRGQSLRQDRTGDVAHTLRMQVMSGICVVILGLTLTGAAGDFLMSLDPHWYSTMFGVYYFAGSTLCSYAVLILIVRLFQRAGYLRRTITIEHYHDLGKYLFGFTFFWGYIAFAQYMLLWYASIPEEVSWYNRRGATTMPQNVNGWSWVIVAILFGQLLIPFCGLLSRHVKRHVPVLVFWAVWVLLFHVLDCYWMVMPEYARGLETTTVMAFIAAVIGIGGVMTASLIAMLAPHSLRPTADPRLPASLAFQNV